MERVRRLAQLWNWLPAFRVVGETEHLPSASLELGVTAPALSRSIKLLERQLGRPVFRRVGRRLELNDVGEQLLSTVRDAMRGIDEGLARLDGKGLTGPIRISAHAHHSWVLCRPAFHELRHRHPGLVPHLYSVDAADAVRMLRAGSLDIALLADPVPHPQLIVEPLAEMSHGIYAGPAHPLYRARRMTRRGVLEHPFVAPLSGVDDGWPPDLERQVAARVSAFHDAVALCASGQYLALLPDAVATDIDLAGRLRRLPTDIAPTALVYVTFRRAVSEHRATDAMLRALRKVSAAAAKRRDRSRTRRRIRHRRAPARR